MPTYDSRTVATVGCLKSMRSAAETLVRQLEGVTSRDVGMQRAVLESLITLFDDAVADIRAKARGKKCAATVTGAALSDRLTNAALRAQGE